MVRISNGERHTATTVEGILPLLLYCCCRTALTVAVSHHLSTQLYIKSHIPQLNAFLIDYFSSQTLLTKGKANPNGLDNQCFSPLHLATQRGRLDIIKLLVSNGGKYAIVTIYLFRSQLSLFFFFLVRIFVC